MAIENFTVGWVETDPDAKLTQTSTTATATTLNAISGNETHLYKDLGAGAYPSDYGPFKFTCAATAQSSTNGQGVFFSLSPVLPNVDIGTIVYEQSTRVWWNNNILYLSHWEDANNTGTANTQISTAVSAVALGATFYCTLQRVGTTVTLKVYSDSAYTTLADTISIVPTTKYSHRYAIVTGKISTGSGATLTFSTSNIDFAPAASGLTIDNTATFIETVSGTTHSSTITLGAGTKRKIVVATGQDAGSATNVTGVTFDGNVMTQRAATSNAGDTAIKTYVYEYDVPNATGTGSKTITVTTGVSVSDITWYAWQLTGAATGAPEYAAISTSTSSVTTVSDAAVTCSSGAAILSVVLSGSASPTVSWDATVAERAESNETNYTTAYADATSVTAGTKTVTATWSTTAGFKNLAVVSIAAAAASGLTITSVTPSSFDDGITGIVIAGSGFGASQGSSTVDIGGQAQTVTAWSDTSITVTSARGSNSMGTGQLKVTIR